MVSSANSVRTFVFDGGGFVVVANTIEEARDILRQSLSKVLRPSVVKSICGGKYEEVRAGRCFIRWTRKPAESLHTEPAPLTA